MLDSGSLTSNQESCECQRSYQNASNDSYFLVPLVLLFAYKKLYRAPAQGSVTWETVLVFKQLFKRGGFWGMFRGGNAWWNTAKPSYIEEVDGTLDQSKVFWDDTFVDEIRQSFAACQVFFLIPIFDLADGGVGNQLNDMSAAMTLNSIPNVSVPNPSRLISRTL